MEGSRRRSGWGNPVVLLEGEVKRDVGEGRPLVSLTRMEAESLRWPELGARAET
jgi:hypothetical protein